MPDTKCFLQDVRLSPHSTPPNANFPARLAYSTLGDPSNPAILLPTCFGGTLATTLPFLYNVSKHADPILDPSKYFIIVTGLLGGSESSSPSNTPAPWNGANFPKVTYEDNVRLQHALCVSLGVAKLFAYIGFSMGGQQAYHFSTLFPDFVENMVCLAGSAKTSWHNWCFLEGPRHALISAVDFHGGEYETPAVVGLRAFNRVYSAWALSPAWFRERCWEERGFETLQEYLEVCWSGTGQDANDLLALVQTWQKGDIGLYFPEDGGQLGKTLQRIKANCLIFPSRTDQYFPPEDSESEVKFLRKGEFYCIETIWGHVSGGGGGTEEDTNRIIQEIKKFLKV
nr:homoserine o-acetyltransferase [Quercus suber]